MRAAELGWRATGWDFAPEHLAVALEMGAIGATASSLQALAETSDVLVLATPLEVTLALLAELAAAASATALILDVASVQAPSARAGAGLPAFVATHPIAGSERSGPAAARGDLFAGRVWAYDAAAREPARAAAAAFAAALGARPLALENGEHDALVALTSHLPQLLAVALGVQLDERAAEDAVTALCGTGIRSMLRLGSSAWTMWRSLLTANAPQVSQEVRRLAAILIGIAEALESGRASALESDFEAAARAVARLGEQRGSASAARSSDPNER